MGSNIPVEFILFPLRVVLPVHCHQSNRWQRTVIDTNHVHYAICAQSSGINVHSDTLAPQVRSRLHVCLMRCLVVLVREQHQCRHLWVCSRHHPFCYVMRKQIQGRHLTTTQENIDCVHVRHVAIVHRYLLVMRVEHEQRWSPQRVHEISIRRLGRMATANLQILLPAILGIHSSNCQHFPGCRCFKSVRPLRTLRVGRCIAADHVRLLELHLLGRFLGLPHKNDITLPFRDLLQCWQYCVYIITPNLRKIHMRSMPNSLPNGSGVKLPMWVQRDC
mmetsp:Transcript_34317/g.75007  ORF Transcript_34317/g.75007 Transcript_34317/m.75007 type:complete len:276 (-) Transcript_34317:526-1353(-)